MQSQFFVAVLALAGLASAQSSLISPVEVASREGSNNNTYPFNATFRYMQIHGDLRGNLQLIQRMSFRRDGLLTATSASRSLDIELSIGDSDYANRSTTFASNFTSTPSMVFSGTVNFPSLPQPVSMPGPYAAVVSFTAPWLYVGTADLAWDWVTRSTSSTGSYYGDAHRELSSSYGSSLALGTGCTAGGQILPMQLTTYVRAITSSNLFNFTSRGKYGAGGAIGAILLGQTNPKLPFPICNRTLYTDGLLSLPITASTTGTFGISNQTLPYAAAFAGVKFYSQAYTADATQSPLPVAVSNGVESVVPALPGNLGKYCRIYSRLNPMATTGSISDNYALVTRFD